MEELDRKAYAIYRFSLDFTLMAVIAMAIALGFQFYRVHKDNADHSHLSSLSSKDPGSSLQIVGSHWAQKPEQVIRRFGNDVSKALGIKQKPKSAERASNHPRK